MTSDKLKSKQARKFKMIFKAFPRPFGVFNSCLKNINKHKNREAEFIYLIVGAINFSNPPT